MRLGLLLDEPLIPWWIAPAITAAAEQALAHVALVVLRRDAATTAPRPSRPRLWWKNRHGLGYALLDRLDRRRVRKDRLPASLAIQELRPPVAVLEVQPETTRFSDRLSEVDVAAIRGHELDVLIRLGFRILRGPILDAARHGTWSFHHGDNRVYRGGPPGVWEVLEDRTESGVTLQRLTEELDGGQVLARLVCATHRFSFERNLRRLLARSPTMLLGSLQRLHRGDDPVQSSAADEAWDSYDRPLYRVPTNRQLFGYLPRLASRYLAQRRRTAGKRLQWSLGWHYAASPEPDTPSGVFHRYREIRPPKDRFWADPFVVREGERRWMFFEELRYAEGRGEVAVWEMGPSGPIGAPRLALQRPYHLSYPQVFSHGGRWYMLPETADERRVELYRAERFPDEWGLHSTLLTDIAAADATLLDHEGRWYLLASVADELHAFVAGQPLGPFLPHPANPLVTDIRWSRMAGRCFRSGGRLYRPSQCGAPHYGAGLAISEVLELTPSRYRERVVHRITPAWDSSLLGMHTLNAAGGLSVVDFLRLARR